MKTNKITKIFITISLTTVSVFMFLYYFNNGLSLAYNDARSRLNIGRRVVEGLKPGLAQIGSVWLPLPHLLMVPTVWSDFFWHTGLSGSMQSMLSFIFTGLLIYKILERFEVKSYIKVLGVLIYALNHNILYLQSTPMTELLLLATMTAGCYYLLLWQQEKKISNLVIASFWIMMSTLNRYDGWFLFGIAGIIIFINTLFGKGYKQAEGTSILYATLAGFGIFLWFGWNALIFKDPLYFALGPFSARSQQKQIEAAGLLSTKGDIVESIKVYFYAASYNTTATMFIISILGLIYLIKDKRLNVQTKIASLSLLSPIMFNIIALHFGHSVLFVAGISGNTWFNVRYGVMAVPFVAIFSAFLIDRVKILKWPLISIVAISVIFFMINFDSVTLDDATVGSSQKNVYEVSGYLKNTAKDKEGFILISAASHDAIIFSSGLPMKRFIHEGTGAYWTSATIAPDRWARWIIMRTYDDNDLTWKAVSRAPGFSKYQRVGSYPFADIYILKDEYLPDLNVKPILDPGK